MNEPASSQETGLHPQKRPIWPWFLVVLAVIVLVTGGFLAWRYFSKSSNSSSPTDSSPTNSSTADSTALMSLCQTANPGLTCEVLKTDGNYATGAASASAGGAHWFAKKTNGTWAMVIKATQNDPQCSLVSDFPKSIAPTCI